jgi:hypothetical protein
MLALRGGGVVRVQAQDAGTRHGQAEARAANDKEPG